MKKVGSRVMIFLALSAVLSGCNFDNITTALSDCTVGLFGGTEACESSLLQILWGQVLVANPWNVVSAKLLPVAWGWFPAWGWLLIAAMALYGPLRHPDGQALIVQTGIRLLMLEAVLVTWHSLSGLAVIVAIVVWTVVGGFAEKWVISPLLKLLTPAIRLKSMADSAAAAASRLERKKGNTPEKNVEMTDIIRFILSIPAGLLMAGVLFGGYHRWDGATLWQMYDNALVGVGVAMAAWGLFNAVKDWRLRGWICQTCSQFVWDMGQNKPRCPYCGQFNAKVSWFCEHKTCKHENEGGMLQCESCQHPRPGARFISL